MLGEIILPSLRENGKQERLFPPSPRGDGGEQIHLQQQKNLLGFGSAHSHLLFPFSFAVWGHPHVPLHVPNPCLCPSSAARSSGRLSTFFLNSFCLFPRILPRGVRGGGKSCCVLSPKHATSRPKMPLGACTRWPKQGILSRNRCHLAQEPFTGAVLLWGRGRNKKKPHPKSK